MWLFTALAAVLAACGVAAPSRAEERTLPAQSTTWVIAAGDGTVVRSSGLTGLTRLAPGRYEARFTQDVRKCAYTATVADPSNALVFNPGLVFTAAGHRSPDGVYVETKNLAGGLTDFPFQLTVTCSGGASESAVVDSDRLVRGSATAVQRLGPGRYAVRFTRDVSGCAYTATIGDPADGLVFSPGLVFTAAEHLNASGVYVETKNLGGGLTDFPFHLAVNCAEGSAALVTPSAVVGADGSLVRGHGALSATRVDTGRYEVRFPGDMRFCAYSATVADTRDGLVFNPGLVYAATGHASVNGVYIETKNVAGGLTDFPFHLSVDCSKRPLAEEGLSILSLNLEGTNSSERGPWRARYTHVGEWMGSSHLIPDALLLQETPGRKCWYLGGCEPYDYESAFTLMLAIKAATGIDYRVAFISTGDPVEGGMLYQGRAVLYNPVRLRNITPRQPWPPIAWPYRLSNAIVARASLPCARPADGMQSLCALIDTDVRPDRTYWGPHWGMRSAAFGRFALAEHEQHAAQVDLYSVHAQIIPGSDWVPDLAPVGDAVDWIEQVSPPSGTRLLPPVLSGDFNTTENFMEREVAETQRLSKLEIAGYAPPPDTSDEVIGTLVGEPASYPSRFAAKTVVSRFLPEVGSGLCGAPAKRWSDHCAQYIELTPTTQVPSPTPAPPLVPNVLGRPAAEAADALRAAGFDVKSVSVADFSCRRLGTVIGQSPAAGSRLFTGETVTIRVAVRPITFCP